MIDFADRADPATRRERLVATSPSAKLVFKILELDAPLTSSQIAERSRLPERTVRHALSTLTEADLVEKRLSIRDARKRLYATKPLADPDAQ